ncbi:agmatinase [Gaopeijia maritima]|uniref:agmatinase n=1 Tax=Gaopeijia maritima TaxID=3119007 RepID=UPI00325615F8
MPNRPDPAHAARTDGGSSSPEALSEVPWELPHRFLGLDDEASSFDRAAAVILPVPWEATTSYGGGTRRGPGAILEASRYIELYDQEFDLEPGPRYGVHTLPSVELTRAGPEQAMAELRSVHDRVLDAAGDRFVLMLGGEHAVSSPAIRSHAARHDDRITVLQFDAHADLRAQYEGSPASHASAMARVIDVADVVGVGLRAVSQEEVDVARAHDGVHLIWADEMWRDDAWMDRAMERLGEKVYITFDVDYFDPSLVPSTGTPEPGGGDWYRTLHFLRRVFTEREVIGCDVVELAPTPGLHAPDFLVAKLVYKLLNYRFQDRY